jgi:hypothetical protein
MVVLIGIEGVTLLVAVANILPLSLMVFLLPSSFWRVVFPSFVRVAADGVVIAVCLFWWSSFHIATSIDSISLSESSSGQDVLIGVLQVSLLLPKELILHVSLVLPVLILILNVLNCILTRKTRMQVLYDSLLCVDRRPSSLSFILNLVSPILLFLIQGKRVKARGFCGWFLLWKRSHWMLVIKAVLWE